MTPTEYIAEQAPERQALLKSIHKLILKTGKNLTAEVAPMMGAEMIQYKINNYFAYALASGKAHMTLHAMPMYMNKPIHEKYSKLLKKSQLQKGCINFKNADEMPLDTIEQFLTDCAKVDIVAVMEKYKKKK